ncbi:MAG: RNA polymerase sigma factor [Bacteroidetes bacterium]|nr:RNA polymerase sigma factor [Bacteroidota bacterium]
MNSESPASVQVFDSPVVLQTTDSEDLDLVQKIKSGRSDEAFARLMKKYQKRVYWLVRRTIFDHYDADEVTQQVFINLYEKIHLFREDSKFYTWLYRIVSNQVLQFLRAQKVRSWVGLDAVLSVKKADHPDASEVLVQSEWEEKLQKTIATLPARQRLVFNMRYHDELSYDEIAEILGTSVGGLKANYFHAVAKVKEVMKNENM